MILAVDIGNSNIVIGGYRDKTQLFSSRVKTDSRKTEWEYAVMISDIIVLNGYSAKDFNGLALSCVVPALTRVLADTAKILNIENIMTVGPGVKTGLNIKIDDPSELGADLACTAVAAIEKYPLPAIIVDLGTATKMLVVDENKSFRGGSIMPGVMVALAALSSSAAQLPNIGFSGDIKVIGTNTIDCMASGSILGTACMIDGMVERYQSQIGSGGSIIACGGLSKGIIPHCKSNIIIDEDLVLDGLMAIYHKNM